MSDHAFATLLSLYMRRIRASAAGVASEIGLSREAVNNWRNGSSRPSARARDKVLTCARYLRLTEAEINRLLAAAGFAPEFPLQGGRGGDDPFSPGSPRSPFAAFIDSVFERLSEASPYAITLLLSQAHWGQPPFREALLACARRGYGEGAVLHIQPPYSVSTATGDYFAAIARQCGFDGVASDYEFEAALEARLLRGERVFCLVSRFEQGTPALRETLAGILRSLTEMHGGRLHLLLCGGEALADLKYRSGDLSLLNIARVAHWPELSLDDLRLLAQRRQPGTGPATQRPQANAPTQPSPPTPSATLDDTALAILLTQSGGHPALVEEGLQWLREQGQQASDAATLQAGLLPLLAGSARLWQAFLPLASDPDTRPQLARLLQGESLGRARPYLPDAVLRRLFWNNLVCVRGSGDAAALYWRSEPVRQAGLQVLESCAAAPAGEQE